MGFITDKNRKGLTYINYNNFTCYKDDEVINLLNTNYNIIDVFCYIIKAEYDLTKLETNILKFIINNEIDNANTTNLQLIIDNFNKSASTVKRAVNNLIDKHLIFTSNNIFKLTILITNIIDKLKTGKCIVIELPN